MPPDTPSATPVGSPVEYKVVDQPWSSSDPAATNTILNEWGQQGWRLINVYPSPIREKTRWIFRR